MQNRKATVEITSQPKHGGHVYARGTHVFHYGPGERREPIKEMLTVALAPLARRLKGRG